MGKIKEKINKLAEKPWVNSLSVTAAAAVILELFIETFARHSLIQAVVFMFTSPLVFIINTLVIFLTLSIASLFRRRVFVFSIFAVIWIALGLVNGVILLKRMTPFTINDLAMLEDGVSILTNYLTTVQIVMLAAGIVLVAALFVILFIKGPKKKTKVRIKRNLTAFIIIAAVTAGSWAGGIRAGIVDSFFGNLAQGYADNGVVYSFITTWFNTGISKPKDYSEESILSIFRNGELENMDKLAEKESREDHPNIVFVQLESFVDPDLIGCIETSKTAAPYFKSLVDKCSSGYFIVPAVGAGTANTEFEAITGMSAKFFGPGEYPYKSVLRDTTMESIPFDLKRLGYSTHAIHNHRAVFYNRNEVFANLGFDDFDALEYMNNVEKTPKNWAKDNVLIGEIMEALTSTDTKDYVYTISVEGHGKYPTEQLIQNPEIEVTKAPSQEQKWQYEYYVNMVHSMDNFVKNLTAELEKFDEDVVLVMYGDHLPALDMKEEDMKSGSLYATQYVIWSNFEMEKEDHDVYAYQIGSYVLDRLGIHSGTLVSYNQNYYNDDDYKKNLKALGYDMLYGKRYVYGETEWKASDLKMGLRDIRIDKIVKIGSRYYIKGQNFTQYSYVTLDGEKLDTTFLSPTLLALEQKVDPNAAGELKVSQIEKYDTILSTTE